MYQPPAFREERPEILHGLIAAHPFATLVTTATGILSADHLPLLFDPNGGPHGVLRGHLAVANPLAKVSEVSFEALAVFQGPHAYVTPSWYPSKAEHGKVVPTWNYAVVQAHGQVRLIRDTTWLRGMLDDLTAQHEAGRAAPWSVADAPEAYLERQMKGIVGLEMQIERLDGKWKASQNKSDADREGVENGLRSEPEPMAQTMAGLVRAGRG